MKVYENIDRIYAHQSKSKSGIFKTQFYVIERDISNKIKLENWCKLKLR